MRFKKESTQRSFTTYCKEVEETVRGRWPDSLVKIIDGDGNAAAVCLAREDILPGIKRTLVQRLNEGPGLTVDEGCQSSPTRTRGDSSLGKKLALLHKGASPGRSEGSAPFYDFQRFQMDLREVSGESEQSRVPFAVLLIYADNEAIAVDGGMRHRLLAKKIFQAFGTGYSIYHYGLPSFQSEGYRHSEVVAVILPATGLKRARQLAEKIRKILAAGGDPAGDQPKTVSIGVGASSFGSKLSVGDFMMQIEESLYAASQIGNCVKWSTGGARESCQVTAEERRQLFSW